MVARSTVRVTRNFRDNLETIRLFLLEAEAPEAFESLLDGLFETVIPNLEGHSEIGSDFLARHPLSVEGQVRWETLSRRLGEDTGLREVVFGDYLVLYAICGT